jgi:hypothetical protein
MGQLRLRLGSQAAFASSVPHFFILSTSILGIIATVLCVHLFAGSSQATIHLLREPMPQEALHATLLSIPYSQSTFTPLLPIWAPLPQASPVPLSRLSFVISSCPATAAMLSDYINWWSAGSQLIRSRPSELRCTIYWGPTDNGTAPSHLHVRRSNYTNYHWKWALMGFDNLPFDPAVDWFVLMDDDTVPFVDTIARFLATFPNPRDVHYFLHGPGERQSGNKLGNGGGGFYVSYKLMKDAEKFARRCVPGIRRRVLNGDIRLDTCLRRYMDRMPDFVMAAFHFDPKVLRGDLTGIIEGWMTKVGLLAFHHIDKVKFELFPKKYMARLSGVDAKRMQTKFFLESAGVLGEHFLKRHIIRFNQTRTGILNEGYSVVFFKSSTLAPVVTYLMGVEQTFGGTPINLMTELQDLLISPNPNANRYYIKSIRNAGDVIEQEYALETDITVTVTVVRKGTEVTIRAQ